MKQFDNRKLGDGAECRRMPQPVSEWAVCFVNGRNPADRGFYEHEGDIPLPADGMLDDDADAFAVLLAQLKLGGLVPGFPDAFDRPYSPRPAILMQALDAVDFGLRSQLGLPIVGVCFLRNELLNAGATFTVFHERPDLEFEDLMTWSHNVQCSQWIDCITYGRIGRVQILPVFKPDNNPFSQLAIMVESAGQVPKVQRHLAKWQLSLRWKDAVLPIDAGTLVNALILWPSNDPDRTCPIDGLEGFENAPAVELNEVQWRCGGLLASAIAEARRSIVSLNGFKPSGREDYDDFFDFLIVENKQSTILDFLMYCGLAAHDAAAPKGWLKINSELRKAVFSPWTPEASDATAKILSQLLGLQIFVHHDDSF